MSLSLHHRNAQSLWLSTITWLATLVRHHQLHQPEPIGMFAGSLLQRDDWDHL